MKKNKKLLKGMTLVEVVVAMTIFFVMFTAIIGTLAVSLHQINKSRRRDLRTAEEAMVVGKKVKSTTVDNDLVQVGFDKSYTVEFNDGRSSPSTDVSLFEAKQDSAFSSDFAFQLATFGKGDSFLGLTTTNTASDEYRYVLTNPRSENVTLYVTITGSGNYIYTGSSDNGYICSSKTYIRNVSANSIIDFGFKKSDITGHITIEAKKANGISYTLNPIAISGQDRAYNLTIPTT